MYINGCNYFVNIFIAFLDCMDVFFMDLVRNEWMFAFMDLVRNEWMFGFMDLVRNEQVNGK